MESKSVREVLLAVLTDTAKQVENGKMTPEQATLEVKRKVSKQDLISVFNDPDIDADDALAIKQMLKVLYNFELPVN